MLGCEFEANGGAVAKNLRNNGRSSATHPNGVVSLQSSTVHLTAPVAIKGLMLF